MKQFFELIFGDLEGYVCLTRKGPDNNLTRDKVLHWPTQADEIVNYCTRWRFEDVYFTPHLTDGQGRRKSNMVSGRVAFGDADTFDLSKVEVDPSIIVHTSPGKTHLYWLIEDTTDNIELERLSHAVSVAHPKDDTGYDTGWATNKLLRVPGTSNNKTSVPYEVHYEVTGTTYTVDEFSEGYTLPDAIKVLSLDMADVPTNEEARSAISWSVRLQEILEGSYMPNQGYKRYEVLHLAQQELFRCGATNEQAFAILQDHSLNKWIADGSSNPEERLWDDIIRARARAELANSDLLGDIDLDLLPETVEESGFDFLSAEERATLQPTFVDKFANWSASKTTTARCFQEAAAFGVLSTVFSELGHIPMKFGAEHLNMWFIIAGRSTIDRKSTVMRHMTRVLDALSDEDYSYDLGGNFTTEGIAKATLNKANRSGIIVRDEFQSLLEELDKSYMSGAKGQLTMMFDGYIPGRLRASEDTTRKAKVKFALSFYGLGIANQITSKLTEEDFYSGFLTRFLWVTPPSDFIPPPLTDGFEIMSREESKNDTEFTEMVQMVRNARTYFEKFTDGLDAPTEPLEISPQIHARMKEFLNEISNVARRLGKEQIASSGQRLVHNTYKAAALLAMVECSDEIKMNHILSAIHYGSQWFSNMVTMSNKISSTQWNRQLTEITDLLEKRDGEMQYGAIYREFKAHYKPREFRDMLEALQDSGYIKLRSEAGRNFVTSTTR